MATKPRATTCILAAVIVLILAALGPAVQAAPDGPDATYAADSILVRFHEDTPAAERANARAAAGAEKVREFTLVPGLEHLRLNPGISVEKAIEHLSRLPFVAYAEPNYILHADVIPNDPMYGNLWGMTNIKAPAAWDIATGDPEFVVAIIDSGIDYNHPDLAANMWKNAAELNGTAGVDDDGNGYVDDIYGWDFANRDKDPWDDNGHGTHTAGTVGAAGNNGVGVVGVNWNVKLMALKFLNRRGSGTTDNAIAALNYAVAMGVKVSNNSWGGGSYSQALYDAIVAGQSVNHLFVAAAGNSSKDTDAEPHYPSSYDCPNIISVAAIAEGDLMASYSNYGLTTVDLAAPGSAIVSTTPKNTYSSYSGTSMATPHVAGAAALIWDKNPTWTWPQVKDQILSTARAIPALANKTVTGGTLDLAATLGGTTPPPTPTPTPSPTPPPTTSYIHLGGLSGVGATASNTKWSATVTVTVHDANHDLVAGALVTGAWSAGATGTASCTTSADGTCAIVKTNLSRIRAASVTFTVNNITKNDAIYDSAANDVGASVTIARP